MGVTSQSPLTYQDCCIVALVSPPMNNPHLKINIPSPAHDEQDHANPPLGGMHTTLAIATPKTPWKPRITLMTEVNNLLTQGMTEDYDRELEHSAMVREFAMETDTSPPLKAEVPALPLDTSSQASVAEMEASMESDPVWRVSHSSGI